MRKSKAYSVVSQEIEEGEVDSELMVRAAEKAGGDQRKARSLYIKMRVRQLVAELPAWRRELNGWIEVGVGASLLICGTLYILHRNPIAPRPAPRWPRRPRA